MQEKLGVMPYRTLQESSDEDLMIYFQSGNHDALAVIVERYHRLVWSVAKKIIHDEGEAEDVVQLVFIELFRKMELFDRQRGILKVWILQLAYSRSINRRYYLQRRKFYNHVEVREEEVASFVGPPPLTFRLPTGETSRMVREAIAMLNPRQRTAIELIAFEGLTFDELATRTAQTPSNAKHHYYRGMKKLREFLSETSMQPQQPKNGRVPSAGRPC